MNSKRVPMLALFLTSCFVGTALLGVAVAGGIAPPTQSHSSPPPTISHLYSDSLAGYIVTGSAGSVTDVRADWNVPQIAKACTSTTTWSAFFVGMDGISPSTTFEAIGTQTTCQGGGAHYTAFYEFAPAVSWRSPSLAISPADHMHAEAKYSTASKMMTLSIQDVTTSKSFSTTRSVSSLRQTGEWMVNAPFHGGTQYRLTDFGWVTFQNAYATVSGHTHSISGFSSVDEVTMENQAATATKVSTGTLTSKGTSFVCTWKSQGP